MTSKEILLHTIHLEKADRVPAIVLAGGNYELNKEGMSFKDLLAMSPEEGAEWLIKEFDQMHSDIIWMAAGMNDLVLKALGGHVTYDQIGSPMEVDPMITKPEDLDKLDLDLIEKDPDIQKLLEMTREVKKRVGDEKVIGVSQWGSFTLASLMLGTSQFMMDLVMEPDAIQAILRFTRKILLKWWNLFLDAGVDLICQAEPVASGDMIGADMFDKFVLPHLKVTFRRVGDRAQAKMLHICGDTNGLLDRIPDTGAQLFSMDHKDDLALARRCLGGKVAFAGNLDPATVMVQGTAEEVAKRAEEALEAADWAQGGYVLMPGCDLGQDTPQANIDAMVEAAHSHKA